MLLPCVVSNTGKYSGKNIGVFINGELRFESKDGFFNFNCLPGDKVILKAAGFFGGSEVLQRTMTNSMEMDNLFFTVK
nr:hypothetical protein [Lysinibacillus timonensis]